MGERITVAAIFGAIWAFIGFGLTSGSLTAVAFFGLVAFVTHGAALSMGATMTVRR